MYDDDGVDTMLATLSEHASDPELDFTWHDAAVMAQRVRALLEQTVTGDHEIEMDPWAA